MRTDEPIHPSFDPAALFHADISRVYQDTFKVFWDPLGGDTFGCIWDPSVCEPRPFRILGGFSSIPVAKVSSLVLLTLEFLTWYIGGNERKGKSAGCAEYCGYSFRGGEDGKGACKKDRCSAGRVDQGVEHLLMIS